MTILILIVIVCLIIVFYYYDQKYDKKRSKQQEQLNRQLDEVLQKNEQLHKEIQTILTASTSKIEKLLKQYKDKKVLLIDDEREFDDCVTVKTYDDGIQKLKEQKWDLLLLDHDLGCFTEKREYTGYDILCFLEENREYLPLRIELVTQNPVAREKMQKVIDSLFA